VHNLSAGTSCVLSLQDQKRLTCSRKNGNVLGKIVDTIAGVKCSLPINGALRITVHSETRIVSMNGQ
jgi:hypothetical protein